MIPVLSWIELNRPLIGREGILKLIASLIHPAEPTISVRVCGIELYGAQVSRRCQLIEAGVSKHQAGGIVYLSQDRDCVVRPAVRLLCAFEPSLVLGQVVLEPLRLAEGSVCQWRIGIGGSRLVQDRPSALSVPVSRRRKLRPFR